MSDEIGAFEAKTRLSELLEQVGRGRSFVITKHGRPVAELRPVAPAPTPRLAFGCDEGRVIVGSDFGAAVPDFADYER